MIKVTPSFCGQLSYSIIIPGKKRLHSVRSVNTSESVDKKIQKLTEAYRTEPTGLFTESYLRVDAEQAEIQRILEENIPDMRITPGHDMYVKLSGNKISIKTQSPNANIPEAEDESVQKVFELSL